MLGALSLAGVQALMTIKGATDGDTFLVFVREVLAPTLHEGDVVIWDKPGRTPFNGCAPSGRG